MISAAEYYNRLEFTVSYPTESWEDGELRLLESKLCSSYRSLLDTPSLQLRPWKSLRLQSSLSTLGSRPQEEPRDFDGGYGYVERMKPFCSRCWEIVASTLAWLFIYIRERGPLPNFSSFQPCSILFHWQLRRNGFPLHLILCERLNRLEEETVVVRTRESTIAAPIRVPPLRCCVLLNRILQELYRTMRVYCSRERRLRFESAA